MTDQTWIKLDERAPTAADADEDGKVWLCPFPTGARVRTVHYSHVAMDYIRHVSHWMAREPRVVPEPPE